MIVIMISSLYAPYTIVLIILVADPIPTLSEASIAIPHVCSGRSSCHRKVIVSVIVIWNGTERRCMIERDWGFVTNHSMSNYTPIT